MKSWKILRFVTRASQKMPNELTPSGVFNQKNVNSKNTPWVWKDPNLLTFVKKTSAGKRKNKIVHLPL